MLNPTMNNTNNSTINESDPWVESGAMVYVALTVATFSAIITCCTWFVVHNPEMCRWCRHRQYESVNYESVNEGENVELRTKESDEDDEEILFENDTTVQPVFTFAGSSSEGDEGDEGEGDEGDEGGKTEGPFV